jgi:hypothetical protein
MDILRIKSLPGFVTTHVLMVFANYNSQPETSEAAVASMSQVAPTILPTRLSLSAVPNAAARI